MNEIQIHSIYINKNNHIDKITSKTQSLSVIDSSNNNVGLKSSTVIQLIESDQYKLFEILVFNIDLEPEHIQDFSKIDNLGHFSSKFLKNVYLNSTIQDIHIPSSIFIFHSLNAIYILFQEIVHFQETIIPKSILKKTDSSNSNLRKTKKVSIQIPHKSSGVNKTKHFYH